MRSIRVWSRSPHRSGARPQDIHAIWRDLLAGSRGLILWDSEKAIVRDDATTGEQGLAYAETFAEIRGGIGAMLIASEPHVDPVAILYSPASFRTQWMLEQKPKGDAWMRRKSETELESNAARDAMWAYRHAITHLGLQPAYVSSPVDLARRGFKTLILPHAIALSPDDVRAIREFAAGGGTVIADVQPGVFDAHSRRQPRPLLDTGMLQDDRAQRAECIVPRRDARRADRGAEWRCHQPHLATRQ